MDWDKLRVFHAVASAGSLTHAGEQLHLSQSAISRQIRGLEDAVKVPLFHRHARGLLLTEQGELLFTATQEMSKALSAAEARIRDSKDEAHGELRVTATAGFGTLWLAPRMARLFEKHPHLSIELILTETILDLPMREADVAIRMSMPNQADVVRRPLMEIVIGLYAHRDYLDEHGRPERLDDLNDHRFLTFTPDASAPGPAIDWLKSHVMPERAQHVKMNSYFGVLKGAINRLGIAALPDYVTRDYDDLERVLPDEQSPPITVYFVYPQELRRSQRVAAFRDFLIEEVERRKSHTP